MSQPKIGFVGLGIMGRPMALNLMEAGYAVTAYNRSKPPLDALVAAGASPASSPRAVAEKSDIVVTMVTDSEAVAQVVTGKDGIIHGARKGSIVVDMSTIAPSVAISLSESLSSKGVEMLDAPVSGGDTGAREATLTIMVGGPEGAYERCLPVLKAMGKKVVHMGGPGAGQYTKMANQILVACNMVGVSECLNFAKKAGLDQMKLIDSLSAGAATSWSLVNLGPKVVKRDFAPGFKVKLLQKDLRYVLESAKELDAPLPATALVHELYDDVEAEGMGDLGTQALVTAIENLGK